MPKHASLKSLTVNTINNMAQDNQFDAHEYFLSLAEKNKLARKLKFKACTCSGIEGIQGVMENYRTSANFIMVDDTASKNTYSSGVTYFDRNVYTVFILAAYKYGDMKDRKAKLDICRRIFRQMHSRLISDRQKMKYGDALEYLDVDTVYSEEFSSYAMNGLTGLFFMINNEEPVDLEYDDNDWEE